MSSTKPIKCTFHSLQVSEAIRQEIEPIHKVFDTFPSTFKPIASGDFKIDINGTWEKTNSFVKGALSKIQTLGLPDIYTPGQQSASETPQTLAISAEQGLGIRTCFVFNIRDGILLIQSGSVNAKQWAKFVSINFGIDFEITILSNPSSLSDVLRLPLIRKISMSIRKLENAEILVSEQTVIKDISKLVEDTDTSEIELTLTNNKGLIRGAITPILKRLTSFIDSGEVHVLKVSGADSEGEASQLYDLVTNQLTDKIDVEKTRNVSDTNVKDILTLLTSLYDKHAQVIRTYYIPQANK